jgi:hypothetical protein
MAGAAPPGLDIDEVPGISSIDSFGEKAFRYLLSDSKFDTATGKKESAMAKRALCIGINDYPGSGSDLKGCVNDANDWREELEKRGFSVTSMLDSKATKSNMVEAFGKIVQDTGRDDICVITYSGHGTWMPDTDDYDDEPDGRDEALCPYDIMEGNVLVDDEIHEIFGARKWGARVVLISDSCHSGSVAKMGPGMPGAEIAAEHASRIRFLDNSKFLKTDGQIAAANRARGTVLTRRIASATVLLAGCLDNEYSYDAYINKRYNGAFTYVALKALASLKSDASYLDWHKEIRKYLPNNNYPQTPNLDCAQYQRRWKVMAP